MNLTLLIEMAKRLGIAGMLANVCEGFLTGVIHRSVKKDLRTVWIALVSGIIGEIYLALS